MGRRAGACPRAGALSCPMAGAALTKKGAHQCPLGALRDVVELATLRLMDVDLHHARTIERCWLFTTRRGDTLCVGSQGRTQTWFSKQLGLLCWRWAPRHFIILSARLQHPTATATTAHTAPCLSGPAHPRHARARHPNETSPVWPRLRRTRPCSLSPSPDPSQSQRPSPLPRRLPAARSAWDAGAPPSKDVVGSSAHRACGTPAVATADVPPPRPRRHSTTSVRCRAALVRLASAPQPPPSLHAGVLVLAFASGVARARACVRARVRVRA